MMTSWPCREVWHRASLMLVVQRDFRTYERIIMSMDPLWADKQESFKGVSFTQRRPGTTFVSGYTLKRWCDILDRTDVEGAASDRMLLSFSTGCVEMSDGRIKPLEKLGFVLASGIVSQREYLWRRILIG